MVAVLLAFLFLAVPLLHGEETKAEPSDLQDVTLTIVSPSEGATYSGDGPLFPSLNLKVGSGPISDRIRSAPDRMHLCISWWASDDSIKVVEDLNDKISAEQRNETTFARYPKDDDDEAIHCRAIFPSAEFEGLIPSSLASHSRAHSPHLTFRAWVRDTSVAGPPRPMSSGASTSVQYRVTPVPCLVGVVISGTMRSFASACVRNRFIAAMASFAAPNPDNGFACEVELLAHVQRPPPTTTTQQKQTGGDPPASQGVANLDTAEGMDVQSDLLSSWSQWSWADDGEGRGGALIPPYEAPRQMVIDSLAALNRTLLVREQRRMSSRKQQSGGEESEQSYQYAGGAVRLAAVRWFEEHQFYTVPNGCASGLPPLEAYSQLFKLAAAWQSLVMPREKMLKRKYSWIVRARWDLAWLRPPPPLETLRIDAISVGYSFWPISDQFAMLPRHLASPYFTAVDSFYKCADDTASGKHWFLPRQIGTEIVLMRHLLDAKVPFALIEVNAPIARGGSKTPNSWCAIRQTLQLPCLVLACLGWGKWDVQDCARPVGVRFSIDDGTPAAAASSGSSSGDSPSSLDSFQPWHPKPYELLRSACENDFQDLHIELAFSTEPEEAPVNSEMPSEARVDSTNVEDPLSPDTSSESSTEGSENTVSDRSVRMGADQYYSGGDGIPGGPVRNRTQPGSTPDWARQALEVRLARGGPGTAEEKHVVRIFINPTVGSLRDLADAADAAAMAWRHPLPSSRRSRQPHDEQNHSNPEPGIGRHDEALWWDSPTPAPDSVDWAVHRALKRILRSAEYIVEVPSEPT